MSSTLSAGKTLVRGDSPIEGYTLEEQIGRGGFGEVWRVNAPGELKKAIKFVYGQHDDSRASRELRSLERIRSIRHPFLLTLERFEIVQGRLLIVTELADGSLEDTYKRHREAGSCGIPRDVLLKYLMDTADGLDYLHQHFGLQHLDVKPANLLTLGGHIKVADFGLLKDLSDQDCSVVGGLTPIYAPPELFDGRPSLHSDQYSLAVLYQEMLTGTRPFSGRTIAQLATQHVHSTPNLEPLPARDRATIARALEKDPDRRFESCSELIEQLRSPVQSAVLEFKAKPIVQHSIHDLPQVTDAADPAGMAAADHTTALMVVALGGTGAECLDRLCKTVMGSANETTVEGVLIDTDMQSLVSLEVPDSYRKQIHFNAVHAPLRSASEYRGDAATRYASISRRWIYNVSREGITQGMRPMGRLAMVDHGQQITAALNLAIDGAMARDGAGKNLRVYVVGSISGGTGGGMYIDVVHQLRHLLDQRGLHDSTILSLMSSTLFHGDQSTRIVCHNTHASLIELNHFLQPSNGYPGDAGAGFASVPAARTPLRGLYLIAGQADCQYGCRPVDTIVDYLWTSSHEGASILDEARNESGPTGTNIDRPSLRTVGLIAIGKAAAEQQCDLTSAIVAELMAGWLGTPKTAKQAALPLAKRIARRTGITTTYVSEAVIKTVRRPDDAVIDPVRLQNVALDGSLEFIAAGISNQLYRELSIALGDPRYNLSAEIEALQFLQSECANLGSRWRAEACSQHDTDQFDADRFETEQLQTREVMDAIEGLVQFVSADIVSECQQLIQRLECLAAIVAVATVEMHRNTRGEEAWAALPKVVRMHRDELVGLLHQTTVNQFLVRPLSDPNCNLDVASMINRLSEMAHPHVMAMVQQHSEPAGGHTTDSSPAAGVGRDSLIDDSSMTAATMEGEPGQLYAGGRLATRESDNPPSPEDAVALIRPPLTEFGGSQRMVMLLANVAQRLELEPIVKALHGGSLSVAIRKGCRPTLVHEIQGIPLQSLIARLEVIGGDSQITSRLASRIDIDWNA